VPDYDSLPLDVLEKRVFSLALAQNDIRAAGAAIEILVEHASYRDILSSEREALSDAVVIAYCRPFVRGSARLPPEWPGYEREEWAKQHVELLEHRRVFVGHSEIEARRVIIESTDTPGGWHTRLDLPWLVPGIPERLNEMCHDLWPRLQAELGVAISTLFARERKTQPEGQIRITLPR
jgi:hypothetical protein